MGNQLPLRKLIGKILLVQNGKGLARTGLLKKTMFGYYMNL